MFFYQRIIFFSKVLEGGSILSQRQKDANSLYKQSKKRDIITSLTDIKRIRETNEQFLCKSDSLDEMSPRIFPNYQSLRKKR